MSKVRWKTVYQMAPTRALDRGNQANHWEVVEVVESHAILTALKAIDIVWW